MPPKRDFKSKKSLDIVTFKGRKVIGRSKFSVPVRYAAQQLIDTTRTSSSSQHCRLDRLCLRGRCVLFPFAKKRCAADASTAVQGNSYAKVISI